MSTTAEGIDVERRAMEHELHFCQNATMLRRSGTTLTAYVETALRDDGLLPGLPMLADHGSSQLAVHYPEIAERLEKLQAGMPEVAR
jgi:hypothetical protein